MPSAIFKAADKRYLINAYAENSTHSTMTAYETGLETSTIQGVTKVDRAVVLIKWMFDQQNTDELIIDLLDHVFVENPYADTTDSNKTYVLLRTHVLRKRNIRLTDDGFVIGSQPTTFDAREEALPPVSQNDHSGIEQGVSSFMALTDSPDDKPQELTESLGKPSSKTVFVVHGRDMRPVEQIERFLLFLGMTMMSWTEAARLTNESQPHTYDIVKAGMDNAGAIVVIFSPDEEARVKPEFAQGESTLPEGQARPNVLVEAGMAFAQSRSKTIFVQSGKTRPITDLDGFNWVSLNGKWDSRRDFINRLEAAGAKPQQTHDDLTHRTAGEFKV